MEPSFSHSLVRLDTQELVSVEGARGRGVVVFQGKVWITQEGDLRDYMVSSGESFSFDRAGLALIEALEPTRLVMLVDAMPAHESIGYEAAWPQTEPVQAQLTQKVRYGLTGTAALAEAA